VAFYCFRCSGIVACYHYDLKTHACQLSDCRTACGFYGVGDGYGAEKLCVHSEIEQRFAVVCCGFGYCGVGGYVYVVFFEELLVADVNALILEDSDYASAGD